MGGCGRPPDLKRSREPPELAGGADGPHGRADNVPRAHGLRAEQGPRLAGCGLEDALEVRRRAPHSRRMAARLRDRDNEPELCGCNCETQLECSDRRADPFHQYAAAEEHEERDRRRNGCVSAEEEAEEESIGS